MAAVSGASTSGISTLLAQQQPGASTSTITDAVVLRLVPRRKNKKKAVRWAEEVEEVDEFSGKKKSKKCCIFHKQRVFGEWSDEDDSDAECECEPPQPPPQPPLPPPSS